MHAIGYISITPANCSVTAFLRNQSARQGEGALITSRQYECATMSTNFSHPNINKRNRMIFIAVGFKKSIPK